MFCVVFKGWLSIDVIMQGDVNDNQLIGNEGDNIMQSLAGNDTLVGNAGSDTLTGGLLMSVTISA